MSESTSRRSFIAKGAAAGAAGAASVIAGTNAEAAPSTDRKLKIGVIGVGRWSFMTWSWSDIIESTKPGTPRGNFGMPYLNMEITHVWDPIPEAAQKFADQLDIKAVKKYDDMLGHIDGLIFADMLTVPYMKTIAKPYLEAGVPTYLSRPIAYSLRDVDDMLESAAKGNTPILATTKFEHYREVPALRNKLKNVGQIKIVQVAANTMDFPMHFHIHQMMPKILGYDVKQVSLFLDDVTRAKYVHETLLYPGDGDKQGPYVCTMDGSGIPDSFHIRVVGTEGIEEVSMPRGYDTWEQKLQWRYAPQIIDMQRTFYGKNFEPYDIVRKKTELFLTAFYSQIERGGAPVEVGTVPVDWRVQTPNIDTSPEF
jgi:predicted dehydrogenase